MTVRSIVDGCPDRVYSNAVKAFLRDPTRSVRLLEFYTKKEREIFLFTSLGNKAYECWIDRVVKKGLECVKKDESEIWLNINAHRYDALIFDELTEQEEWVDKAIRRGLK